MYNINLQDILLLVPLVLCVSQMASKQNLNQQSGRQGDVSHAANISQGARLAKLLCLI